MPISRNQNVSVPVSESNRVSFHSRQQRIASSHPVPVRDEHFASRFLMRSRAMRAAFAQFGERYFCDYPLVNSQDDLPFMHRRARDCNKSVTESENSCSESNWPERIDYRRPIEAASNWRPKSSIAKGISVTQPRKVNRTSHRAPWRNSRSLHRPLRGRTPLCPWLRLRHQDRRGKRICHQLGIKQLPSGI